MCLGAPALAVEPQFVVTMRFDGSENRVRTFYTGQTEVSSTTRTWQGGDNFSISLSARSAGGQRDDLAELEGTLTIVRIRWTGDAQTPPPEVTKFRVRWQQWSSLYVFSGEQAAFAHTHVEGITPEGTYEDRLYHGGPTYSVLTGGRPQNDPWRRDSLFQIHRSQFTWNPLGWWQTGENVQAFFVTLDADAALAGPDRYLYMECGATLYLTVDVTTKFVTIGPDTWKKGADPQGNPIPVLNTPDEGDTAVKLTYNLWRLQWEWTTDITHQLDFKPSLDAWHSSYYCPGPGAPPFLTNPNILWSAVGAHSVAINVAIPTSARVMQNYGAYIPYNMPSLSDYSLRVQVTDNTDGFTDVAEKRMRVHFPIEKSHKYYPDYTGRLGNGKMIAVPVENLTDHQIRVTFIVSDTHRFTWSTQTKWRFDVEAKVKEVTFGGSYERTTTDEEQFELGRSVAVDVPVPSHHVAYCIVYPYGRREFWVVDHYGECGFLHQDAFRDDVRPERSGLFPWMLSIVIQHRDDLPPDMTVNAPDPSWP